MNIPASVKEIRSGAFTGCGHVTLYIGNNAYAVDYCERSELPYYEIVGGWRAWKHIPWLRAKDNKSRRIREWITS